MARGQNARLIGKPLKQLHEFLEKAFEISSGRKFRTKEELKKCAATILQMEQESVSNQIYTKDKANIAPDKFNNLAVFLRNYYAGLAEKNKQKEYALFAGELTSLETYINSPDSKKIKSNIPLRPISNANFSKRKEEVYGQLLSNSWYSYERVFDGIARKVFKFEKTTSPIKLKAIMDHMEKGMENWEGMAELDRNGSFLIINLYNRATYSEHTHYMLAVNNIVKNLDIAVGHMTFENPKDHNIVSKTVILQKIAEEPKTTATAGKFDFHSNEIDEDINRFFLDKQKNRLSSPHNIANICSIDKLKTWHKENINELYGHEDIYKSFLDEFDLFYKLDPYNEQEEFITDYLKLSDDSYPGILAIYRHEIDNGIPLEWEGGIHIDYNSKILSIRLHGPFKKNERHDLTDNVHDKPVFLMLNIPPRERTWDTLTGVIMGIRDDDKGAIGRIAIITRSRKETAMNEDRKKILQKFFLEFSKRSLVRPPINPCIYKFRDLGTAKGNDPI